MKFACFCISLLVLWAASPSHAASCTPPNRTLGVDVPSHPFSALPDAEGCWLFVSASSGKGKGAVVVLHDNDGVFGVEHTVALSTEAYGEALSHDGQVLVVAGGNGTAVLDVKKLEAGGGQPLLGVLPAGSEDGAVYAAISPNDKLVFVADEYASRISVFDLAKARADGFSKDVLVGHVPVAAAPVGMAFSPDGQWLYATSQRGPASMKAVCKPEQREGQTHPQGLLFKIDVAKAATDPARAVVTAWPAGCNPVRIAMAPSGKQLWVTARGDNALLKVQFDEAGRAAIGDFPIGNSPVGIAVRPDGKQAWVAVSDRFGKNGSGQLAGLTPLDGSAPTKLLSVAAPGFPRELSFLPDGRTLVATLFDGKQVQFVTTPD
jgi:DNA-binding beta-propeller fold protein YncE